MKKIVSLLLLLVLTGCTLNPNVGPNLGDRTDSVWQSPISTYIETTKPTGYNILINGLNRYLNFNAISGSTGYGFRDDSGDIQVKHNGGAWTTIPTSTAPDLSAYVPYTGATSNLNLATRNLVFTTGAIKLNTQQTIGYGAGSDQGIYIFDPDDIANNIRMGVTAAGLPYIAGNINGGITTRLNVQSDLAPHVTGTYDLGTSALKWQDLLLAGNLSDGTNTLTVANAKTAYTHSQDNTQAHSDYLLNNSDDSNGGFRLTLGDITVGSTPVFYTKVAIPSASFGNPTNELANSVILETIDPGHGADSDSWSLIFRGWDDTNNLYRDIPIKNYISGSNEWGLLIDYAPAASNSSASALMMLGTGGFSGGVGAFSGSKDGTFFGINQTSGLKVDYFNGQNAGVSEIKLGFGGTVDAASTITGATFLASTSGTAAAPAFRFSSDPDNGMRLSTTNTIALVAAGADRLTLASGTLTFANALNMAFNTSTGTKIGTGSTQKIGFWNATPIVQPTALTTQLTSITHTAPGTPDYAIQDFTQTLPYGFVSKDEANTMLSVIANLQTRVSELETKLQAIGLIQ